MDSELSIQSQQWPLLVTTAAISLILARERRGAFPREEGGEGARGRDKRDGQWCLLGRSAHRHSEALRWGRQTLGPAREPSTGHSEQLHRRPCHPGLAARMIPGKHGGGVCVCGGVFRAVVLRSDSSSGGGPCRNQGGDLMGPAPLGPE